MSNGPSGFYEQRHVLFCDILGFTNAVLQLEPNPSHLLITLSELTEAVREANRIIEPESSRGASETGHQYTVTPRAEHFSDCIVVSTPATNVDAIWLCEAGAAIQNLLARRGFLSRGAICTGLLHHSEEALFGPALANAVSTEQSTKLPRIEVSSKTYDIFRIADTETDREIVRARENQLLVKTDAGPVWLDPFHYLKLFSSHAHTPPHPHVAPAVAGLAYDIGDRVTCRQSKRIR